MYRTCTLLQGTPLFDRKYVFKKSPSPLSPPLHNPTLMAEWPVILGQRTSDCHESIETHQSRRGDRGTAGGWQL